MGVRDCCNSNATGYQKIHDVEIRGSFLLWGWRTCDVYIRDKHGNGVLQLTFADPNHPEHIYCVWDGYEQTWCTKGNKDLQHIALFVPKGHTQKGEKEFKSSLVRELKLPKGYQLPADSLVFDPEKRPEKP